MKRASEEIISLDEDGEDLFSTTEVDDEQEAPQSNAEAVPEAQVAVLMLTLFA